MSDPNKDNVKSVMQMMAVQAKQERELYGQTAEGQPGRDDGPPEQYDPPSYGSPPWTSYASEEELLMSRARKAIFKEQRRREDEAAARLPDIARMDISFCLETEPTKRDFIVYGYLPGGVVGLLIGTGSTGKSYLALMLCMAVACGRSIRPFEIPIARVVMIINVEDDHQDLHYRMRRIAEAYQFSPSEKKLLDKNLIVYPARGQLGPLMELRDYNPTTAKAAEWLKQQVNLHQPGLVILDTKSRLYGLDENSNDHGAQWVGLLENMLVAHPTTSIMIVSHTSKASATTGDHHAIRGASSVGDNCRFGMALTWVQKDEAKSMGIKDPDGCIKMDHTKASYSKQLDPVIFRKNDFGVPVMVDIDTSGQVALGVALDHLIDLLRQDHPEGVNKRQLERGEKECKAIKDQVVELSYISKKDWPKVVTLGIESVRLEEFEAPSAAAKNKPVMVRARQSETQDFADDEKTQYQLFQTVTYCHGRNNSDLELS